MNTSLSASTSTAATTASTIGSTSAKTSVVSASETSKTLLPTTKPSFAISSSPTSTSTQSTETFAATTVTVSRSSSAASTTLSSSTTSEVTMSTSEMSTTLVASTSSPVTISSSETTSSPASTGTTQTTITPVTTATSALTTIPSQTTSSSSTTTSTPVPNIKLEEKEISNKDDFQSKVTKGSHISRKRTVCSKLTYKHHMLVIKVEENTVDVIEYTSPSLGKINVPLVEAAITKVFGKIKKTTIKIDDFFPNNSSEVFIVNCDQYQEMTAEQKDDAIQRAESRLGEQEYFVTCNNCENFVTWALLGESICEQCKNAGGCCRFVLDCIDPLLSDIPSWIHLCLKNYAKISKLIYFIVSVVKIWPVHRDRKDEKTVIRLLIELCSLLGLPDQVLEMVQILMLGEKNFITIEDMWREIFKRLFSFIIFVVATICNLIPSSSAISMALKILSRLLFRDFSSAVGGLLFDNVMLPKYRSLPEKKKEQLRQIQTLLFSRTNKVVKILDSLTISRLQNGLLDLLQKIRKENQKKTV